MTFGTVSAPNGRLLGFQGHSFDILGENGTNMTIKGMRPFFAFLLTLAVGMGILVLINLLILHQSAMHYWFIGLAVLLGQRLVLQYNKWDRESRIPK
jgi:hypothetical protein